MKVILSVVGVLAFMLGVFFVIASKGAGNDVAAAVIILVGIVALGFSGVIDMIEQSNNRLVEALARPGEAAPSRAPAPPRPVAAATPGGSDDEVRALMKQAEDLQFASKFKEARVTYAEVVERFPGSKQAATAKQQLENLRNA